MPGVDRSLYVAVVGSGDAAGELYEKARGVGRLIAGRGGIVVCGVLSGIMEAAARGATEVGGIAIGELPDEDRERANIWVNKGMKQGQDIDTPTLRHAPGMHGTWSGYSPRTDA